MMTTIVQPEDDCVLDEDTAVTVTIEGSDSEDLKCPTCGVIYITQKDLDDHDCTPNSDKPFKCDYCDFSFYDIDDLEEHLKIHREESEDKYMCYICEKNFLIRKDLQVHMMSHRTPFRCNVCSKCFLSKNGINMHMKMHEEEGKVKKENHKSKLDSTTKRCIKKARLELDQMKSLEQISVQKPKFKCEICELKFPQKALLKKHLLSHATRTAPKFKEEFKALHNNIVQRYSPINTEDKPFSCDFCGNRYMRKGDLARHTRTHTGENPFKCTQCEKKFYRADYLNKHMNTHKRRR